VTQLLLNIVAVAFGLAVPLCFDANVQCIDGPTSHHMNAGELCATSTVAEHVSVVDSPSLLASEKDNQPVFDIPSLDRLYTQGHSAPSNGRELRYYIRSDESGRGLIFDKTFFASPATFFASPASPAYERFPGWNHSRWAD
jgi:hypothetical protein